MDGESKHEEAVKGTHKTDNTTHTKEKEETQISIHEKCFLRHCQN